MNMRGDLTNKNGKARFKYQRGKPKDPFVDHGSPPFKDYLQNMHSKRDIIPPFPCKCIFCNHPYYRFPDFTKEVN